MFWFLSTLCHIFQYIQPQNGLPPSKAKNNAIAYKSVLVDNIAQIFHPRTLCFVHHRSRTREKLEKFLRYRIVKRQNINQPLCCNYIVSEDYRPTVRFIHEQKHLLIRPHIIIPLCFCSRLDIFSFYVLWPFCLPLVLCLQIIQ